MRIAILGDSIAEGLGARGRPYAIALQDELASTASQRPPVIENFAKSGATILFSKQLVPDVTALCPDYVIIAHGVTESILRPPANALVWVPKRWRKPGWLDPRPYFSRRLLRGLFQKTESAIRWRIKVLLLRAFGGESWMGLEGFAAAYKAVVAELLSKSKTSVVLVVPCDLDERFFPGTNANLDKFRDCIRDIGKSFGRRVEVCETERLLNRWTDFLSDRFHPNAAGHQKIALAIAHVVREHERRRGARDAN